MADLTIKINGDLSSYENALEDAQKKTSNLNDHLGSMAKVGGVAFAAMTAEIGLAVKAFGESQQASQGLVQALQNQGIYSDDLAESYKKQAADLQHLTGIDDDAIIKAQTLIQGMIGNQKVTYELSKAIVDLSVAKKMDLESTAELIGKGIEGHVMALDKLGIHVDQNLDKQQRTAKILELVSTKFGDQATAANQGLGSIKGLHSAFSDFQENIGERFAPFITTVIKSMTGFFEVMNEHKAVADLAVSLLVAGAAVGGITLAVGLGGLAWAKYTAVMEAASVATGVMNLATKGLMAATGIGLLVVGLAEVYLNWSTIWPAMQAIYKAFVTEIVSMSGALSKIISGVYTFDMAKVKQGLEEAKNAVKTSFADGAAIASSAHAAEKKEITTQNAAKAILAKQQSDREITEEKYKQATLKAERELALAKINDETKAVIDLKTQELDTLKAIQDEKNLKIRGALKEHLAEIRSVQALAKSEDIAATKDLTEQILANDRAYQSLSAKEKALFLQQNNAALKNSLQTEQSESAAFALKQVQDDITRRNKYLADEKEFGIAYATINQLMHTKIAEGTGKAFGEMQSMQNSQNSTLKGIGKAAAIANITIKTGESAMNVMAGFSTIPIIGPILGAVAAAAMIAYGAEQIGTVMAANKGGIVTGGIPGIDSVPAMLTPGELVVPKQNFNEVVSSVAQNRAGDSNNNNNSGGFAHVVLSLKGELMEFIETQLVERKRLGISIQGST